MIRVSNLKLKPVKNENDNALFNRLSKEVLKQFKLNKSDIKDLKIIKKSIDARKLKDISIVCTVDVCLEKELENKILKSSRYKNVSISDYIEYNPIKNSIQINNKRPVVVGAGPAGLLCSYILALNGFNPILIERGKSVDDRKKIVDKFWEDNELDLECNVQFGEGGAGTFSDGKLNTQIKDKSGRIAFVLKTFIENGAKKSIAYDQKPHIGTDVLIEVVRNLREEIIRLGGEVLFDTKLIDFDVENGRLKSITIDNKGIVSSIDTDDLVLAIGHSARDTFYMLKDKSLKMSPKSFAVGYRVMHDQILIDKSQYGDYYDYFGAAPYKLTYTDNNKRGVFSFCDCPGGYVVNASSESGRLAINGMSYSGRDSMVSNSAIIVQVDSKDFGASEDNPLAGVEFQREIEEKAFAAGKGYIPLQRFADYLSGEKTSESNLNISGIKGRYVFANLKGILPGFLEETFIEGMHNFGQKIKGFDAPDVLVAGVESRTSSPVRIERDDMGNSNILGIYPCGEGAGYAGGITSAAVDGIKVAENIILKYGQKEY